MDPHPGWLVSRVTTTPPSPHGGACSGDPNFWNSARFLRLVWRLKGGGLGQAREEVSGYKNNIKGYRVPTELSPAGVPQSRGASGFRGNSAASTGTFGGTNRPVCFLDQQGLLLDFCLWPLLTPSV